MKRVLVIAAVLILLLTFVLPALPRQSAPLAPEAEAATYETAWWPDPVVDYCHDYTGAADAGSGYYCGSEK